MLLRKLFGDRDLLIPYFKFGKVLREHAESKLLQDIFKLRYDVYCVECHYLSQEEFQGGLESDEYDGVSTHFAAFALDESIIGTVRLVQPGPEQVYPFEGHCGVFPDHVPPPREQIGEVSRLVVRKSHRRRAGDSLHGVSREFAQSGQISSVQPRLGSKTKRRGNSPMLLLGLYREMYRFSRQNGVLYWYAAMEQTLAGSLDRMGFHFVPIGPETDYYGPVTPFIVNLEEANQRLHKENKFVAAWFNDEPISVFLLASALLGNFWEKLRGKASPVPGA